MKKSAILVLITVVCVLLFALSAGAAVRYVSDVGDGVVITAKADRKSSNDLCLPAGADLKRLTLDFGVSGSVTVKGKTGSVTVRSGQPFDLTALFAGQSAPYEATYAGSGVSGTLTIARSAGAGAMFITTDDPVGHGRAWVDQSKSNSATGAYTLLGEDGAVRYSGKLTQFKPRGNSSFTLTEKKSYQIKLKDKADLVGDDKAEACKKWVLLANVWGPSMTNTAVTFDVARAIGMPFVPHYTFVDLYVDGDYRGAYQLCEKTEIGSTRIDIDDPDERVEEANADNPAFETPVVAFANTSSGAAAATHAKGTFRYVKGLTEPAFPDGASHHAYLLEIDLAARYDEELTGFITNRNLHIVTKSPEYLTYDMGLYVARLFQEFEDACYSADGKNAKTGKYWYDYCDPESLVYIYLFNELGKNVDSFRSSLYFYLPEDSEQFRCGPLWDFDRCYGIGSSPAHREVVSDPTNFYTVLAGPVSGLIRIESFRDRVKAALDSETGAFYREAAKMAGDDGTVMALYRKIAGSLAMNARVWYTTSDVVMCVKPGAALTEENSAIFTQWFIGERLNWLSRTTAAWNGGSYQLPVDDQSHRVDNIIHTRYHNESNVAATCTAGGFAKKVWCDTCGKVFELAGETPALGHEFGAWTVEVEPTDDAPGRETRKCVRCDVTESRIIPMLTLKTGDADGDGNVTARDARLALRYSAKLETLTRAQIDACSVLRHDGRVTAGDARRILRVSARLDVFE